MACNIYEIANKKLREGLFNSWQEEEFSDLTLKTTDSKFFKVHKIVLSSSSEYFRRKLKSNFTESNKDLTELDIKVESAEANFTESNKDLTELDIKVESEDLKFVLNFIYTGECEFLNQLDLSRAQSLYYTFVFLEMDDIGDILHNHLIKLIYHKNCLDIWRLRETKPFDRLQDKIMDYIRNNTLLFLENNLQRLNIAEIFDILSNKDLNCRENECLKFIEWVKINFRDRQRYLTDIFNKINFDNLSCKFIENNLLHDNILYENNDYLRKMIMEAYSKMKSFKYFYDLNKSEHRFLVTETNFFDMDMTNQEIVEMNNFSRPKLFSATKFHENKIFFTGGMCSKKVQYLANGRFFELPSMSIERFWHSSVNYNDKIYCCGGNKGSKTEIFDLGLNKWIQGPTMEYETWAAGLIQKDPVLYAFNMGPEPLIQMFDTRGNSWETLCGGRNLRKSTRIITKAIVYKDKIYVLGSIKCQVYNIENNHLRDICYYPSETNFSDFEVFEFNGCLCIFGSIMSTNKFVCFKFNDTTNEFDNYLDFSEFNYGGRDLHIF